MLQSLIAQLVKTPPAMWETGVHSLGWEDPLENRKATHSSILAWRIPWTVAYQAPLSMGFSSQEYWSGLPCPPPGDLPSPGIEPRSPALQVDSLLSKPPGKTKNTRVGSVQFSHSVVSDSLQPHGLQHTRPPCPSLSPGVCSNLCPLSQ